jgi:hypothetical protein
MGCLVILVDLIERREHRGCCEFLHCCKRASTYSNGKERETKQPQQGVIWDPNMKTLRRTFLYLAVTTQLSGLRSLLMLETVLKE